MSIDKSGQSGGYSGLLFQNISSVKTPGSEDNKIVGHPGGPWSNITFDNVVLGGKKIKNVNDLGKVGENVTDFIFK